MNGWVRTSVEGPAELLPVAEVVGSPVGRADAIRVSERWSVTTTSGPDAVAGAGAEPG